MALYHHRHRYSLGTGQAVALTGLKRNVLHRWAINGWIGAIREGSIYLLCESCIAEMLWVLENYPLSVVNAAQATGIPRHTLHKWVTNAALPAANLPNGTIQLSVSDTSYVSWLVSHGLTPEITHPTPYQPGIPHDHRHDMAIEEALPLLPFPASTWHRWISNLLFPSVADQDSVWLCRECVATLVVELEVYTLGPTAAAKTARVRYLRDLIKYARLRRVPALILPDGQLLFNHDHMVASRVE